MADSRQVLPTDVGDKLRLMGHHHLCMMGGDALRAQPEFKEGYAPLLEKIDARPDVTVETIFGYDVFCYDCPYWSDDEGRCSTGWQDKISKDAAVLDILGIKVGEQHTLEQMEERIARNLTVERFHQLCGPGEWECDFHPAGHCLDGLKALKRRYGVPEDA